MNGRQTITIMKACELASVSRRTIYNWISGGKIEFVRNAGGNVRIFVDSLWRTADGKKVQDESTGCVSEDVRAPAGHGATRA